MKRIEAIIPEDNVVPLLNSLESLPNGGFTYHTVKGRGRRTRPMVPSGRSGRFESIYSPSHCFFIIAPDRRVEELINLITSHAKNHTAGEGKIFIYDVDDAVDVGTKERGESSI